MVTRYVITHCVRDKEGCYLEGTVHRSPQNTPLPPPVFALDRLCGNRWRRKWPRLCRRRIPGPAAAEREGEMVGEMEVREEGGG